MTINAEEMTIADIARITHQVNKALCEAFGDNSQVNWEDAPDWQKESAKKGVWFHIENPDASPSESHESWLAEKEAEGWGYGPVKDTDKRQHPCFVPYDELPESQKSKDYVFKAIVHAVFLDNEEKEIAW